MAGIGSGFQNGEEKARRLESRSRASSHNQSCRSFHNTVKYSRYHIKIRRRNFKHILSFISSGGCIMENVLVCCLCSQSITHNPLSVVCRV